MSLFAELKRRKVPQAAVAFLAQYGVHDEDFSDVEFDPPYPPEIREEIERIGKELAKVEATDRSE